MKKIICLFTCLFNFSTVSCTDVATIKRVKVSDEFDYSVRKKRKTIKQVTPKDLYTEYCNKPNIFMRDIKNYLNNDELTKVFDMIQILIMHNFFYRTWNMTSILSCEKLLFNLGIEGATFNKERYADSV